LTFIPLLPNFIVLFTDSAEVWLTVPERWDGKDCEIMKQAGINAGLVQAARANDRGWRGRLKLVPQLEAIAVHCASTDTPKLEPPEVFFIFDAAYDQLSVAAYKVGQVESPTPVFIHFDR
jgi:hypothetical protein